MMSNSNTRRNVMFAGLCLVGFGSLCANFLPRRGRDIAPTDLRQWAEIDTTVESIDQEFEARWREAELLPADPAESMTVARRISLALTGTIPSLEELRAFEQVPDVERIPWWTDRLLRDRRSSDYLAERFARAFVGTEEGPFLVYRRRRFVMWLSDQIYKRRPYDEIVRELIAGKGLWTDTPAVNFLTVTNDVNGDEDPDEERLAARTTRAFLGVRLDCVQCHDDNLGGEWLQRDFHQLAAFYTESRSSLLGISDKKDANYEYKFLYEDEPEIVTPQFPFCDDLEVDGATRREALGNWVTHPSNQAFAHATVNRMWALMFGQPLVSPIDNIPLNGPYPPALESLAADFSEHGFDLHRLIRAIASTRAFQLDSRADHRLSDRHEEYWAAFPLTRLRPEQVAGAISQANSLKTIDVDSHIVVKLTRFEEQGKFVERYGDTGDDEFGAHGGTIPQRLLMLNGNLVTERTKDDLVANATTRIAALTRDDHRAIDAAYLCVLSRKPAEAEAEYFLNRLRDGKRKRELEDLFWVLLNSTEFSWNH